MVLTRQSEELKASVRATMATRMAAKAVPRAAKVHASASCKWQWSGWLRKDRQSVGDRSTSSTTRIPPLPSSISTVPMMFRNLGLRRVLLWLQKRILATLKNLTARTTRNQSTARRKQTATPKNQYFFGERIEWEPGRVIIRTWYL